MRLGKASACLLALAFQVAVLQLVFGAALELSTSPQWQPRQELSGFFGRRILEADQSIATHVKFDDAHTTRSRLIEHGSHTGSEAREHSTAVFQHRSQQAERALDHLRSAQRLSASIAWGEALKAFKARQAECVSGKSMPGKYMLIGMEDDYAGLGNQFPSVITGFLVAMVTERCYFIDFPFYHKTFMPDMDLNWKRHVERMKTFGHNAEEEEPYELGFWKAENLTNWLTKDQKKIYAKHYGICMFSDPDYTGSLLAANPHHAPLLNKLFPTREMFHPVAKALLKVKAELMDVVMDFKRKHFKLYTVGIQIRRLKCDGEKGSINCDTLPAVENFVSVARALQRSQHIPDSEFRIFVAADLPETYEKVVELLGPEIAIYRADNGVGTVKSKVIGVSNPSTPESALIDMRLLSECNEVVVTVGSSYGSVAAGMGGIVPVQMIHGHHQNVQNPYWYKAITSEPCFWKGNIFLNTDDKEAWGTMSAADISAFKANPFWMQYIQCHCST